jgi:molybdenum transport protein
VLYVAEDDIERFIKEDVPYIDLTTLVLEIGGQPGKAQYYCRENAVICGTEEALRIFEKLGIHAIKNYPSGTPVCPDECFLEVEGEAANLHMAWKVTQNLLEYCSGIATRTRRLVDKATGINPNMTIVATRKMFPGAKSLAIKAVVAGGGYPHRLGLSETVLVFPHHLEFCSGLDGFIGMIPDLKRKACEKRLIVEVESADDAIRLCRAGVDGVQFDKGNPGEIRESIRILRSINPGIVVLAAGGINEDNIEDYASTGVDAVVTSSVYFGKPTNIGVKMCKSHI